MSQEPLPNSRNLNLPKYAERLRSRMRQVNLSSYQALSQAAGVSKWQIEQLRQGKAAQMRLSTLDQIAIALKLSLDALIREFSDFADRPQAPASANFPQKIQETDRSSEKTASPSLQTEQREQLQQEFQQATLQKIESWLIQFPTAAYAAQQNPQFPAAKLLPLMRPIEQLLQSWGIEAIAPVGTELPYDPQQHQLLEGTAQPGDIVRVRYTGYRQGNRLLYRAQVSPSRPNSSAKLE
jgi:DNA-binding Xre family transcriptional regulator